MAHMISLHAQADLSLLYMCLFVGSRLRQCVLVPLDETSVS